MDAIDKQLILLLGGDGRMPNREIARRIGVSEGTIRQRLGRLMEQGDIRVTAQVNTESLPESYLAFVGVKLDGRRLNECAEEVETLPGVITTMIVTGRYDLFVVVLAHSHKTLVEFVTTRLSHVAGVKDSETYVVLRNLDPWVAAEKLAVLLGESGDTVETSIEP